MTGAITCALPPARFSDQHKLSVQSAQRSARARLGDFKGSEPQSALNRMAQMLNIEETGHRFRPTKIGAIEFPMNSNHSTEDYQ
jgi:hypothetical protein